jgi:hypothetical protein
LALQVTRGLCLPERRCLNGWEGFVFHTRVRDCFRDKLRYPLLGVTMRPALADRQFVQLPRQLAFLYYVIRPIRLAVKYGRSLWASARSSVASCWKSTK